MSFTTQRDIFLVPFRGQDIELQCPQVCGGKLKRYDSTVDDRCWAVDELKRSNFLVDFITCRVPAGQVRGDPTGAGQSRKNKDDSASDASDSNDKSFQDDDTESGSDRNPGGRDSSAYDSSDNGYDRHRSESSYSSDSEYYGNKNIRSSGGDDDEHIVICEGGACNKPFKSPTKALRKKVKELSHDGKINKKAKNNLIDICADIDSEIEELDNEVHNICTNNGELAKDCQDQAEYIKEMECGMEDLQQYYEVEIENSKINEEMLKCRCQAIKEELVPANTLADRTKNLQMENDVLRNQLKKKDIAINAYDCQYQQQLAKAKAFKNAGYRFLDELPDTYDDDCQCDSEIGEEQ